MSYLNYYKLKPYHFELDENELDYFIDLYNKTVKLIQKRNEKLNWFKKLLSSNVNYEFNKDIDNKCIQILNKYMSKKNDIIFNEDRFRDIEVGKVDERHYDSCLTTSLLSHKLLVIVKNDNPTLFNVDVEVLFDQDDGTVYRKRYELDEGDVILLRPHNVVIPIENDKDTEESENENTEDSEDENSDIELDDETEEDESEEYDGEIKYIIIEITDKEGKYKLDKKYFY